MCDYKNLSWPPALGKMQIASYGLMFSPALVINGKVYPMEKF